MPFFQRNTVIGLQGILIVDGIAVINQETVGAGIILETVEFRFILTKLTEEAKTEFTFFILFKMFDIIASHVHTGIIGLVGELIKTYGGWFRDEIGVDGLITYCFVVPAVDVGV